MSATVIKENDTVVIWEELFYTSDGIGLYTRSVFSQGQDKHPIVFIRTPYEDSGQANAKVPEDYVNDRFVKNGYAVVTQHVRGRGNSEGECIPYANERRDGLESLDYLRRLPFYNGEIYLLGGSYLSTVHLSYLSEPQSDIKGAVLMIQTDKLYDRNFRCGMNYNLNNLGWWGRMLGKNICDQDYYVRPYIESVKKALVNPPKEYIDSLLHNECDEFWQKDPKVLAVDNLTMPTLFVEGWYDFYIGGMLDMWERLPRKESSAMIVGPYGHKTEVDNNAEYPLPNGNIPADFDLLWFESIRSNTKYPYAECGRVNYYEMASDTWKSTEYPLQTDELRLFLTEDGRLSDNQFPASIFSYRYDPNNLSHPYRFHNVYRAAPAGKHPGVLSFFSETAKEDLSFLGKIKFNLSVSTDCTDTAFFARLYFVEEGVSYNLTEAVGALSYFIMDYKPGEVVQIRLESTPISFKLKKGSALRVDISSESGIFMPHPNVKGHFALVDKTQVAHNKIYTDGSFILLPLTK